MRGPDDDAEHQSKHEFHEHRSIQTLSERQINYISLLWWSPKCVLGLHSCYEVQCINGLQLTFFLTNNMTQIKQTFKWWKSPSLPCSLQITSLSIVLPSTRNKFNSVNFNSDIANWHSHLIHGKSEAIQHLLPSSLDSDLAM